MLPTRIRKWVEAATGGLVTGAAVLPSATSSLLHSVQVKSGATERSFVLRRFTDSEWVKREPEVAAREAASLRHATHAGLQSPELVALDADGFSCGVPATLVTMLRGSVVLQPENNRRWLDGLAQAAVQIHRVDATGFAWTYHRYNEHETLAVPRWSKKPEVWKKVIEIVDGPSPPYRECFVHRDYHPSNVLWYDGTVSGVVDWVNGCRGPAGIDVAWCRHNLANLHGVSLADEFLSAYIAAAGPEFRYNPYWDLMSVVELLPGPPTMYVGWRASGLPDIGDALMRQRVDLYAESVVARL